MPDRPRKIDLGIVLGRAGTAFDEDSAEQVEAWLRTFLPDALIDRGVRLLMQAGFEIIGRSRCTLSLRATPDLFESYFSSKIVCTPIPGRRGEPRTLVCKIADDVGLAIPDEVREIVGTVTIQPASRPVATVSATAPLVPGAFFLDVMNDLPALLKAPAVHATGISGAGVRLTMIDTGFEHSHPFFVRNGFRSEVLLAGEARSKGTDRSGHGTGCSANVFAIAPGVVFTGVKLGDDVDGVEGSAPLLAGFQRALGFDPAHPESRTGRDARPLPQIISVSVSCGEKLDTPPWNILPQELTPLEACVREAVLASDVTVVAAAGNLGERGFPGQMKRVIAVGGVFKPKSGPLRASGFASSFTSRVYAGRKVPDCCGLCGDDEPADYIMLPVPAGSEHDVDRGIFDGTTKQDGWARFSGTSAAAPQVAAVCALMLEKNPNLTPQQLKSLLKASATEVDPDRATGAGLVNAKAAVDMA